MILFENNKKFVNFIYLNLSLINIKKNLIIILFSIIMKFLWRAAKGSWRALYLKGAEGKLTMMGEDWKF